ncbi:hypothetical protein ACTFIW_005834 [Dictyostelium discoideum]
MEDEDNQQQQQQQQPCYILNIPFENLLIILQNLHTKSLLELSQVNLYFNQIISNSSISNLLWNDIIQKDFLLSTDNAIIKYKLNINNEVENNNNTNTNEEDNEDEEEYEEQYDEEYDEDEDEEEDEDDDNDDDNDDDDDDINEEANYLKELRKSYKSQNKNKNKHLNLEIEQNEKIENEKLTPIIVNKLLNQRFNSNIIRLYKPMRNIWDRFENWMDLNSMDSMKKSFHSISHTKLYKLISTIKFVNNNNNSNNNLNNDDDNNNNNIKLPEDYLCSMLIHNGQKEFTRYGLLGTVEAYESKTNIFLLSLEKTISLYKKTRNMQSFQHVLFVACSASRRYYIMALRDFKIEEKSFKKDQILLIAPGSPMVVANSFWEFLYLHAFALEKGVFTTRRKILYRYPEFSPYNGNEVVTQGVKIKCSAVYIPEDENSYTFFYRVTISMDKDEDPKNACQLTHRFWIISTIDGSSNVNGPGVIGKFPIIKPGVTFEYCSRCEIERSQGHMGGYFTMVKLNNRDYSFRATVPTFFLTTIQS